MKRLLMALAGLLMVLSLLVPAALSYETPYGDSIDTGTAIQSGSQSTLTTPSDNSTSRQNDFSVYQQNDPNAYWVNGLPNQLGNASTEPSGQPLTGRYGTTCMEMGGTLC